MQTRTVTTGGTAIITIITTIVIIVGVSMTKKELSRRATKAIREDTTGTTSTESSTRDSLQLPKTGMRTKDQTLPAKDQLHIAKRTKCVSEISKMDTNGNEGVAFTFLTRIQRNLSLRRGSLNQNLIRSLL